MTKITRILRVEDTRMREEGPDDRWYPVPGSGIENNCGRCGRAHEVHATVEIDIDGTLGTMIVGTGCMKADEAEVASQIRSVLSAQRTLAKHERLLAKYEALSAKNNEIMAKVRALPVPAVEKATWNLVVGSKREIHGFQIGDARVSSGQAMYPTRTEQDTLEYSWRLNRARELGQTHEMAAASQYIDTEQREITKLKRKIEEKINGSRSRLEGVK